MNRITFATAFTLATLAASVNAHSPVRSTQPADGASLEGVPEMLHMTFARPARVIKLSMTHDGAQGSTETRLDVPGSELLNELHLTPVFPGSGHYAIDWRALGEDGHVMKGTFTFNVQ